MMLRSLAALAVAGSFAGIAAAGPIEAEDWEKYPAISGLSLSWEGDVLVGMVHEPGKNGLAQAAASWDLSGNIDTSKPLAPSYITPGNKRMRLAGVQAIKGGKVIVIGSQAWTGESKGCLEGKVTGNNKTFIQQAYMTDVKLVFKERDKAFIKKYAKGRGGASACEMVSAAGATVVDILPLDDDHILLSRFEKGVGKYVKYNLKRKSEEVVFRTGGDFRPSLFDRKTGTVLAESGSEPVPGTSDYEFQTRILNEATGKMELEDALTVRATDRFEATVEGRDDKTGKYFINTDKFRDKTAIYLYDAKTNQFDKEPVFAHPDFSVSRVRFSSRPETFNQVTGFVVGGESFDTFWVDPEMKSIQDGLNAAFEGKGEVEITSWNKDMSRVLFAVGDERFPTTYYMLVDKSKVAAIGNSRPWVQPEDLGKQRLVYYNARDGLKIPAYLTYPAGWTEGDAPAPLMVVPHGGPWVRDQRRMDLGFVQTFASKGYFVLQPQYRGSQGFGRELWLAGDNEWGKKMQDDKDDGAAWLVSKGYVDGNKMAMMGYSYGGFAAMAAAVRPNSPYQCAIAGAGVSNLDKLGNNWSSNRIQKAFQGRTVTGMDPVENVEKANIPILIIHGDRDVRVPLVQGTEYYDKIKKHTNATFYLQKDAPHGFPWPEHRREWIEQVESYLSTTCNMPPPNKS